MIETLIFLRPMGQDDLDRVGDIHRDSHEAAAWAPAEYLKYESWVAEVDGQVAGFLVSRSVDDESELLNLAVGASYRRQGIGRTLLRHAMYLHQGLWFLEVRASNAGAIELYKSFGFSESGRRKGYYQIPPEDAIVMRFFS